MINLQSIVLLVISYFVIPRLNFLPKTVHSLLIIFGPFLLPRLADAFNNARSTSKRVPVRPTPPKVKRALNLLAISTVVCLILSLPQFGPENVFLKTQSRLQIDANVLFTRLRTLYPERSLTGADDVLRTKFASMQNRLVYLTYGPDTLVNCIWCSTGDGDTDARNYFLYTLPKLIAPHVLHLAILGLATSSMIGPEGSRFRTHATIAGLALLVAEAWYLGAYDLSANKRARMLQDIDFAHWRVRVLRWIAFAGCDALLGALLWATSTNRLLAKPESLAQRLETTTRQVEQVLAGLRALGLLSNSINRDPTLRNIREAYWRMEGQQLAEVVQEEEVMTVINSALGRMDIQSVEGQVGHTADTILAGIDSLGLDEVRAPGGVDADEKDS